MFTSDAWFFDDIGGLEPRQAMRYAARACELAGATARSELEASLITYLARAVSNDAAVGTGKDVYARYVSQRTSAEVRVGAGVGAAHALALDTHLAAPRAYSVVSIDGNALTLETRRTGKTTPMRADVKSNSAESFETAVEVVGDGTSASVLVPLNDFAERARHIIRAKLRHKLLSRSLTEHELAALANGDTTLRDLAARALVRAIDEVPRDASGAALRHAHAVLDLLDQLETPVPFDAQTAWWHVRSQVRDGRDAAQIAALGTRLGFDISALAVTNRSTR
jgi:hypothetical protein